VVEAAFSLNKENTQHWTTQIVILITPENHGRRRKRKKQHWWQLLGLTSSLSDYKM